MHIDIVSDVICPWCFIEKRRLERALAERPELTLSITWRAFQLNPEMPAGGMPRESYLAAKFGGGAQASRVYAAVTEAGRSEGIEFAFERIRRTPNTQDAHRLIRFAAARGRPDALVEALFQAYFTEGRDIGVTRNLVEIAAGCGYDADAVSDYLVSGAGREELLAEERSARRLGINAVPCFIIDGSYAISGAQEPEFFLPLFDLALNRAPRAAGE
jgi:predicted DsbA family dithiol-disulfide isomerase